jgi:hypothetical protein
MKIRMQDNSVRFRITVKELETLAERGELVSHVQFPGDSVPFNYGLRLEPEATTGAIAFNGQSITASLSASELKELMDDSREGIYFRQEPTKQDDQRFIYFIEKDRPGSACQKPEQWIYEEIAGKPESFRPIEKQ